jgi:hypothetical protein
VEREAGAGLQFDDAANDGADAGKEVEIAGYKCDRTATIKM